MPLKDLIEQFDWWVALDIALIAVAIYYMILLVRGTRAAQVLSGVIILLAVSLLSSIAPLITVNWVMSKFYSSIILILVVLFQDDIRHALSKIGEKPLMPSSNKALSHQVLDEIARAVWIFAEQHTGALIVIERNIILSRYVDIGTLVNAKISKELLLSIFHTNSPLHDGAVIVQQGRITAAGCFLPLTRDETLVKDWGTRHRAALGISEETDALTILVSEERGQVLLVLDGKATAVGNKDDLRKQLQRYLIDEPEYRSKGYNPRGDKLGKAT